MKALSTDDLDEILALQFLIGWAGEGRCEPPRLGWWASDLVDEMGGGDFMRRLMPNTHRWAALEAVRECALQRAEKARKKSANAERVRSLFYLGANVQEGLGERLRALKESAVMPTEALPALAMIEEDFQPEKLAQWLGQQAEVKIRQTPGGRLLSGPLPDDPLALARHLAAAHVPFEDSYPLPYCEV